MAAACSTILLFAGEAQSEADAALIASHPVLDHDLSTPRQAQMETFAKEIMALSEAEVLALVPVQTPFITSDCPACGNRHFARGLDRGTWKFTLPGKLSCVKCNAEFPGEKFPLNDRALYLNTLGEQVEITFHRNAKGQRFALPGALQSWQSGWLTQRLDALAKLYHLKGDEAHARRVVLLLHRYAEVFPHYLVKDFLTDTLHDPSTPQTQKNRYEYVSTGGPFMRDGRKRAEKPQEPEASNQPTSLPYGWTQSRWGNDIPSDLLRICDLVYRSGEFEKLSREVGHDVRARITERLFGNAVAYVQEFPFYYQLHNNASSHVGEIIRAGRVLGQPEWVHFGYRWSREVLEKYAFSRDGAFAESPGYLYVFLATQEANFTALLGYSDPPGYVGKTDGLHLKNLGAEGSTAFLQKARMATESIRFPNGSSLPLGDNRNDDYLEPLVRPGTRSTPLTESRDVLLPGYGHAVLGDGTGDRQVQAHLQFSHFPGVVHTHMDGLSLMLWAFGAEIFTDVGYHKSKYRGYATTTLSHNTVVIDRKPQSGTDTKGDVLLYEPNLPGLSLIQVEGRGAYEAVASRYRRTLLLNTRNPEAPYLVDVFEVRGGRTHDYALHGPTLFECKAQTALPLEAMSGERPLLLPVEKWTEKTGECPYGVFTKVRSGPVRADFTVDFTLVNPYERPVFHPAPRYKPDEDFHFAIDPASYAEKLDIGVRSWFAGDEKAGKTVAFLADSPSLIRSGLSGSDLTEKLKRPSLLLRSQGSEGLHSVFVAVHEPFHGAPKITSIKRLPIESAGVALQVDFAGRSDTVLLSLEGAQHLRTPSASMHGRVALISTPREGEPSAFLVGGTSLEQGLVSLKTAVAEHRGVIEAIHSQWSGAAKNAFVTSATLEPGERLRGTWMHVALGKDANGEPAAVEAFEIDRVERRGDKTWICLKDDPGMQLKSGVVTETFFPRRQFEGVAEFTIHTTVRR